jgi:hypothetical protein
MERFGKRPLTAVGHGSLTGESVSDFAYGLALSPQLRDSRSDLGQQLFWQHGMGMLIGA